MQAVRRTSTPAPSAVSTARARAWLVAVGLSLGFVAGHGPAVLPANASESTLAVHPGESSRTVTSAAPGARTAGPARPNIVFITTDDQRADDMQWMPFTQRLLGGNGVTFENGLSPHPLCCPARAEFVSGQYGQNNGVHHNKGEHGGYPALKDPGNTIGRWLDAAGYQTAMVGKYMNGYRPDEASRAGWDHWNPSIHGVYSFTNTLFYNDGDTRRHTEHVDDVVTSYAATYIREFSKKRAPFFVWASDLAPHDAVIKGKPSPPLAAPRHRGTMSGIGAPSLRAGSFGLPIVGGPGRARDAGFEAAVRARHVQRVESLQAVDEGVRDIVRTLKSTGEWDDTYVVFTSDNGFMLGEHGLTSKNHIFEEALKVPMIVKVPGRLGGTTSSVPVTSVDLAPTLADLAGATPERDVDGVSFAPLLTGEPSEWRDTQLIQTGTDAWSAEPGWDKRGVRTDRYTYAKSARSGGEELYDRRKDPFQTVNLALRAEYQQVLEELRRRTEILKDCAGSECSQPFAAVPDPEPLLEPLPSPPPRDPDESSEPTPVVPSLRATLSASDTRVAPRKRLTLSVKASGPITSVTWLQRTVAGKWRKLSASKGSGSRMVLRTTSRGKPGKQRFKATVVLKGGVVSSKQVVITTVPARSIPRSRS
jgi:N-acetylglucosamine-6-sulfatase